MLLFVVISNIDPKLFLNDVTFTDSLISIAVTIFFDENASIAQDSLITGINVFMHEGKDKFFATNYAGKPVLVVCCEEEDAKRATRFYELVYSAFPKYSAMVPLTNYLKHPALALGCAYVQLMPEGYEKNNVTNPDYYGDFRRDSWMLHGFALIDLISDICANGSSRSVRRYVLPITMRRGERRPSYLPKYCA